jgi:glycosyltransferase involved in cell wall biosynthesis
MPFLSVIVCTYNRAELLEKCLASLCAQEPASNLYEVIVVDNNSKDDTFSIVSRYTEEYENVRYVTENNQGLSYARNKGCDKARGRYLAYIDDDAVVPPQYLSNVLVVINQYEPDIMGGPVYPYYTEEKPCWFRDSYEIRKYEEKSGFSRTCRVSGGNLIIKRDILRQMGMFDVELGMKGNRMAFGEEAKVLDTYRIRTPKADQKVYYALECYVRHCISRDKMRIGYVLRRRYLTGRMKVQLRVMSGERITMREAVMGLTIRRGLYSLMRLLAYEMVKYGPGRVDYVYICRESFLLMGQIIEGLNQMLKAS